MATLGGLPLAAQGSRQANLPAPVSIAEAKAQIEADNRNRPVLSVALEEQVLAQLGPAGTTADRLWFLAALAKDAGPARDAKRALEAARQGQALAGPGGSELERIRFGILVARALQGNEQPREALAELQPILPLLPRLARDQDRSAKGEAAGGYRLLGHVRLDLNLLPEAMDAFTRALRLYDELGEVRGQAITYNLIAGVHSHSGRHREAEAAILKALEYATASKDEGLQAQIHLALSNTYQALGNLKQQVAELEKAQSLAIRADIRVTALWASVNLSDVYLQAKDYASALRHSDRAVVLAERAGDRTALAIARCNKGIALNRLGRPGGIDLLQQGLDHLIKVEAHTYIPEVTGVLAEEYAFNHDFEKAYQTHVRFKTLSDALQHQEDKKRIADAQAAYQSEKQQLEIAALQKDRRQQVRFRNLWILAGVMGLSAAVILVLGRNRLQVANKALEDMALRDPLTGLANRRYLSNRINEDLAQILRLHRNAHHSATSAVDRALSNVDVVFMMIDIDHFKQVNDQHGHAAGDAVLKQFASILVRTLRDSDTVVRWGGEEFFILAKHAAKQEAAMLAERIRKAVADHPFDLGDGNCIHKTCSVGFATYPFMPDGRTLASWESVAELADQCLYAAKFSGRDMVVGILPCGEFPEASEAGPSGGYDASQFVKAGVAKASWTEGRQLAWPDDPKEGGPDPH